MVLRINKSFSAMSKANRVMLAVTAGVELGHRKS